ncbi:hypothetical protein [Mycolicibacterium litorale]|uniref:Uncharacterized protein n=1 Tax=Mycolicibacterium litorale TaxID=758802 RepID=A0AAD1MS51_9MYCO|nr:hypothetical protein [Mycolicibacterium litorale]MCV7415661.1 hypothetical protein [Mycolicibacterium litorale]TDY08916.1 hypothetical protein BCL50_0991 [Mycolicibacterium litorale]BBY16844.1 hypothetical protein MLIT_24360 [Mycolicibacterium litorale]
MTAVLIGECTGLWRRTLLVEADGSRDTGTGVVWLQGESAYVDSRGFAGTLLQRGNIFEWRRDIDLQPPGEFPDVGAVHWDGDTLVERGVHADYVEHWVRDSGPATPCSALWLTAGVAHGLLLRVGGRFGWASGTSVVVGAVGDSRWNALDITTSGPRLRAGGVRWDIERTEGEVEL